MRTIAMRDSIFRNPATLKTTKTKSAMMVRLKTSEKPFREDVMKRLKVNLNSAGGKPL